jgi:DUF4097 and DUF4098 domain-containing protein YvlB
MKKIMYIGLSLLIIGIVGVTFMFFIGVGTDAKGAPIHIQKQHDGTKIKNIEVISNLIDIEVYPSTNDQIQASLTGIQEKNVEKDLQMSIKDQTLEIKAIKKQLKSFYINFDFNAIKHPTKLKVLLPQKQYNLLALQTDNGNIHLKGYQGDTLKINTINGNINLQNTNAVMALKTNNGNIEIDSPTTFHGNNHIQTENGEIEIQTGHIPKPIQPNQKPLTGQLNIQTDNGNITLKGYQGDTLNTITENGTTKLQDIDATLKLESDQGTISLNSLIAFRGNNQIKTEMGDIEIQTGHQPNSLNIDFKADNIESDFPIQSSKSINSVVNQVLQGSIGSPSANQPLLKVHSDHGDILFKK